MRVFYKPGYGIEDQDGSWVALQGITYLRGYDTHRFAAVAICLFGHALIWEFWRIR